MPGFLGYIGNSTAGFSAEERKNLLVENKSGEDWFLERRTLKKFADDKPFYEDNNYLLLVEGVILNRKILEAKYGTNSFTTAILAAYQTIGETFFKEFRGSFSGLLYDKRKNLWLIYTDHIGDKQVFYSQQNKQVQFGSEMGFMADHFKLNHYPLSLNEEAAYMLLTYGFLIENHSLALEIKKLTAGHYLRIASGKAEEKQYHRFSNEPDHSKSQEEWIDGIDSHFRKAIQLQFDKDLEYGYKHITTLSGGLDSRMTVWVAHEMGYTEQLNTTFSQSKYLDETIARQIATDLKHEWLFKALDHGDFLKDLDAVSAITYGGGSYAGLAHGKSMYDLVNFEAFGLVHTGQIGDAIIGTFYQSPIAGTQATIGDGAYSQSLIEKLKDYPFRYEYANTEIFSLYSRAFTGANQGLLVFQEHSESVSPFTDVEFLQFCYSIPVEIRYKHKIYFDWILQKYPKSAEYIWERIKTTIKPIPEYETIKVLGRHIQKGQVKPWLIGAIKRRIPFRKEPEQVNPLSLQFHMNPYDYWYETNQDLRKYLDDYFNVMKDHVKKDPLVSDLTDLYLKGTSSEKLQVLTLLAGIHILEKS